MHRNDESPDRISGDTPPVKPTAEEVAELAEVIETGFDQIKADLQALIGRASTHYCPLCGGEDDAA